MEKSSVSPFGKGEKTVVDLDYRNGREIVASDVTIGHKDALHAAESLQRLIENHVSEHLFVGKPVTAELYKLTMYEKGGHFDWHRDTTHGDDHHATVLVALNTEWQGGGVKRRHGKKTVDVDMHPVYLEDEDENEDEDEDDEDGNGDSTENGNEDKPTILEFKFLAFYTDIKHKVMPV